MTTSEFDADRPPERGRRRRGGGGGGGRRGRRGDPHAVVPEPEFTSYYDHNVVKPAPWGEEIAAYLFLGGLAAGSALVGAGGHFTGRPRLERRSRLAALVAGSLGGLALIADLGRPERALNMMRTMKLTSPMSVGSWILMGFMGTTGAAVALDVATPMTRRTRAEGVARVGESLASAGSAFFAPPLAAYTAVLLSATATPTWHEAADELPFVFVGSATAAGAGLSLVTTPPAETMPARVLAAAGAALDLVADHRMGERLGMLAEPLETGLSGRLHRAAKVLTLAGGIGALVGGGRRPTAALSGLALMAGSVCTRLAVFHAGIASAKDPKYTIVPQRERAEAAARAGHGVTQPGEPAQDA